MKTKVLKSTKSIFILLAGLLTLITLFFYYQSNESNSAIVLNIEPHSLSSFLQGESGHDEKLGNDLIIINRIIAVNGSAGKTTVNINVTPLKPLRNVTIYDSTPMCFGASTWRVVAKRGDTYEVDTWPVKWKIEKIRKPIIISYSAETIVDEYCWNTTTLYAKIGQEDAGYHYLYILIGLLVIFLVILISVWHVRMEERFGGDED